MSKSFLNELAVHMMWKKKANECLKKIIMLFIGYAIAGIVIMEFLYQKMQEFPVLEVGGGPRSMFVILMIITGVGIPAMCADNILTTYFRDKREAYREERRMRKEF